MRDAILKAGQGERDFRWRGQDISRIENFSDIVFALTLSLLVASSVPGTFGDLIGMWREAIAITLCFALFYLIWQGHYHFFRRYALEDGRTVFLNILLLLIVMLFAYPLKFLALFLVELVTYAILRPEGTPKFAQMVSFEDTPRLTALYSVGYLALFGVFHMLFAHAASKADALELSDGERLLTRYAVFQTRIHIAAAIGAIVLSLSLPTIWGVWAGWTYVLIGPAAYIQGNMAQRKLAMLQGSTVE